MHIERGERIVEQIDGWAANDCTGDGKPLPFGTLGLHPAKGKPLTAAIQSDGTYQVKDVPVGKYVLTIDGRPPKKDTPKKDEAKKEEKGLPIPPVYTRPDKSPLAVEVAEGNQVFDLNLAP